MTQATPAHAQEGGSPDVLNKVTKLNKKALDAYQKKDFDAARGFLKEALDLCANSGLDKHPIKARTHIHYGIVMVAGFKQRDAGIKHFKKALQIQPDIQLTKSVATPALQDAFEEAMVGQSAAGGDDSGGGEPQADNDQGAGTADTTASGDDAPPPQRRRPPPKKKKKHSDDDDSDDNGAVAKRRATTTTVTTTTSPPPRTRARSSSASAWVAASASPAAAARRHRRRRTRSPAPASRQRSSCILRPRSATSSAET